MLTFGIYTVEQYARARGKRPLSGASVSYGLLKIGDARCKGSRQIFSSYKIRSPVSRFHRRFSNDPSRANIHFVGQILSISIMI